MKLYLYLLMAVLLLGSVNASNETVYGKLVDSWFMDTVNGSQTFPEVDYDYNLTLYGSDYNLSTTLNSGATYQNGIATYTDASWIHPENITDNIHTTCSNSPTGGDEHLVNFTNLFPYKYGNITINYTYSYSESGITHIANNSFTIASTHNCINQDYIMLRFASAAEADGNNLAINCWNGSNWNQITYIYSTDFYDAGICDYSASWQYAQPITYTMNGNTNELNSSPFNLTNNGVTFKAGGIGSQHGYFNGTAYANYSTFPGLGNAATWSAWVYDDGGLSTFPRIIGSDIIRIISINTTQTYSCWAQNNSGTGVFTNAGSTSNNFNLVSCVYNGTHLLAYQDGTFIASSYLGLINQSNVNLHIGSLYSGGQNWNGGIDDVRIYSSALSAADIKTLYEKTRPPMLQDNDALNFSGVGSFINSSASVNLSHTDKLSVETRFTYYNSGNWAQIVEWPGNSVGTTDGFRMYVDSGNTFYAAATGNVGVVEKLYGLTPGTTYHIIATVDKSTSPDTLTLYVNGESAGFYSTQRDNTNTFGYHPIYMGKRPSTSYLFNGTIDYIKVYDDVLTAAEVADRYLQLESYSYSTIYECANPNVIIKNYLEDYPSTLENNTLELYGTYWSTDSDANQTVNLSLSGNNTYSLCFHNDDNGTIYGDYYYKSDVSTGFSHRYYYYNESVPSTGKNYSFYNYNTTTGVSTLKMTIRDQANYDYYSNVVTTLERFYVGEGVWRPVQIDLSGEYGEVLFNIKEDDTDYRLKLRDTNNNLLSESSSMKFSCTSGLCEITYTTNPYTTTTTLVDLDVTTSYNNDTGILQINWSDSTATGTTARIIVARELSNGSQIINQTDQTGTSGTYSVNLSGYTGYARVTVTSTNSARRAQYEEWIRITLPSLYNAIVSKIGATNAKADSAFFTIGIIITVTMIGAAISPVMALVLLIAGLLVSFALGISSVLSTTFTITATATAILIAYVVKHKW